MQYSRLMLPPTSCSLSTRGVIWAMLHCHRPRRPEPNLRTAYHAWKAADEPPKPWIISTRIATVAICSEKPPNLASLTLDIQAPASKTFQAPLEPSLA
ncbi:unnamed protein product [Zymoseptoria tritici ST99CH_1A5]|uniref:Uncharacterized protein n=1 Tax=Zymoseptoria tritici ST99CH_1A5 TaxID=1276529 RepID=A0A1Y6LSY1_ZYMTR|nr:unnamed protein product [Zymoseptoria tritici ST99CH_3D1]SMY26518.1 unnamed protein product [Zymoseptoria tritici ST99CH_1A5]